MEGEEEQAEGEGEKDCQSVEIGRVWNVGCVEREDMPQEMIGSDEEEEGEVVKFRGEWEQMSKQEKDWQEYVKT